MKYFVEINFGILYMRITVRNNTVRVRNNYYDKLLHDLYIRHPQTDYATAAPSSKSDSEIVKS